VYKTDYGLNSFGQLTYATVADGIPKTLAYTLDEAGQIIRRAESRTSNPTGPAPRELFYRYGGKQLGMTGNDGTADVDYETSMARRQAAPTTPSGSRSPLKSPNPLP
jgi:hypothetical protein